MYSVARVCESVTKIVQCVFPKKGWDESCPVQKSAINDRFYFTDLKKYEAIF